MIRFISILLLGGAFINIQAQEADFILSKFFATQAGDEVLLRWTIEKGNTCEDTYVERSEDGSSYNRIGLIGGICGSPDASITYDFFDTNPLPNRQVFYRLMLGQYGFTSPRSVEFIRFNEEGFILAPNPASDLVRLKFENMNDEEHTLMIFNTQGKKVLQRQTRGDEFIISQKNLGMGLFIYRVIKSDKMIFNGKLVAY